MLPGCAPLGETQGFEPLRQISPAVGLPLGMPLTVQVTAASGVPVTVGVKARRCETTSVTNGGETPTVTLLVMVTEASTTEAP